MSTRPQVLLVSLGGTIAGVPDERGRNAPAKTAADLLSSTPGAEDLAEVRVADVRQMPSRAISPPDMHALAREIREGVREGCEGVVVTHGTDTMEETAYALALMLDIGVPVALTGAMRPGHVPGSDGPANLLAALRVAATREAAALGPVVVMHDEVHAARWVTKAHTSRVAAFASPSFGPVGTVLEGRVRLHVDSVRSEFLGVPDELSGRVELVWVSAGADGALVDATAALADGLVIAGTGGGHVPPAMAESLQKAVEGGLPVVLASRCAGGPVLEETYGGVGSESHLRSIGLVPAGTLGPLKARLRLMVALAVGEDPVEAFSE
ncbi:asparaginase [Rubrobacter marinus]|uniref:asparaginase n=1 Tax=Rubrobacter marinus TaxID=2653852 RepID=UPI001409F140|nr:asparaginase [Rubrobacter marinus]